MARFKFMLDRGVTHLRDCFAPKRVVSTETLGLRENLPDDEIVAYASQKGYLLVASNRRDFLRDAKRMACAIFAPCRSLPPRLNV